MIKNSGRFDIVVKFEDEKIADSSTSNFKDLEGIFDDLKKKFKGGR